MFVPFSRPFVTINKLVVMSAAAPLRLELLVRVTKNLFSRLIGIVRSGLSKMFCKILHGTREILLYFPQNDSNLTCMANKCSILVRADMVV